MFSKEYQPLLIGLGFGFLFALIHFLYLRAPDNFPANTPVTIPQGLSLQASGELLKEEHVITSVTMFSILSNIFEKDKIVAGSYMFERPLSVFGVAERTATGDYHLAPLRVTFTEGETLKQMAGECHSVISTCDIADFLALTKGKEGYIFPDTYFVLPGSKAQFVVDTASKTFGDKIAPFQEEISNFGKPLSDDIVMASILEKEASSTADRKIIAGILWKRIRGGMALQVDAPFLYILNKTSAELTANDLKIKSPYNTYTNLGLPPTPIGNPGLDAIEAAILPTETPYLYYLSDKHGVIHYAQTFEEHVANKQKYIN